MSKQEFIKHINSLRKAGGWYAFDGVVEGKKVKLKAYKTYIQRIEIDGLRDGNSGDCTVKEFNAFLEGV